MLSLEFPTGNKRSGELWTFSSIFTDVQRQLGLKLDTARASVEYLVIDDVKPPSRMLKNS